MNHAIMRSMIHPDALPFNPSDDLLLEAIDAGWRNTPETGDRHITTNNWIPVKLMDYSHAVILAKVRGYRVAKLGWGVLVITQDTYTKLEHHTPEDERDNTLMQMFNLTGDAAEWWTRQY